MAVAPGSASPPRRIGNVAAIVATVVLVAGIVGVTASIVSVRNNDPVKIATVTESVDTTDGCAWVLEIELLNSSDEPLMVQRIAAILNQGRRTGTLDQPAPQLAPGETGTHVVRFRLPAANDCPAVDEINHGNIIFILPDGDSESVRI